MLLKAITLIVFIFLIYKMTQSISAAFRGEARRRASGADGPTRSKKRQGKIEEEDMVYDEVCGSYISEANAVKMELQGRTLYFCNDECRQKHLVKDKEGRE